MLLINIEIYLIVSCFFTTVFSAFNAAADIFEYEKKLKDFWIQNLNELESY